MDPLLTPEEVATRLRVAVGTLANWRTQGRGPEYTLVERSVRYPASKLEEFIAARKVKPE